MSLVGDAGVALKWFLANEPDAGPAPSIVRDEAVLTAPDLLIVTLLEAGAANAQNHSDDLS